MNLYTIGFSGKSAEEVFTLIRDNQIVRVIDIRLRPYGQLSGFAKKNDLEFFLRELTDCEYVYLPKLAPTDEIMKSYRNTKDWEQYVRDFSRLMTERNVPYCLDSRLFEDACLLCSETEPDRCHRRLVAEIIEANWEGVNVVHLR